MKLLIWTMLITGLACIAMVFTNLFGVTELDYWIIVAIAAALPVFLVWYILTYNLLTKAILQKTRHYALKKSVGRR